MLEFYQAYADYRGVMDLTQQLIEQAAMDVNGGTKTKWGEHEIDWAGQLAAPVHARSHHSVLAGSRGRKAADGGFRVVRVGRGPGEALQLGARAHGLRSKGACGKNHRRACSRRRRKSI